jgi:hypothetical protein
MIIGLSAAQRTALFNILITGHAYGVHTSTLRVLDRNELAVQAREQRWSKFDWQVTDAGMEELREVDVTGALGRIFTVLERDAHHYNGNRHNTSPDGRRYDLWTGKAVSA